MPHFFHLNHILQTAEKVKTIRVVPLYNNTTGTFSLEFSIPSPRVFLSCFVLWGKAIFLKVLYPKDTISLSRTTKIFGEMIMTRKATTVWKDIRDKAHLTVRV